MNVKSLLGSKITEILHSGDFTGFLATKGKKTMKVWIEQDSEGNGPGFLRITSVDLPSPEEAPTLTMAEATAAADHASNIWRMGKNMQDFKEISSRETTIKSCPETFTPTQRELVANLLSKKLKRMLRQA